MTVSQVNLYCKHRALWHCLQPDSPEQRLIFSCLRIKAGLDLVSQWVGGHLGILVLLTEVIRHPGWHLPQQKHLRLEPHWCWVGFMCVECSPIHVGFLSSPSMSFNQHHQTPKSAQYNVISSPLYYHGKHIMQPVQWIPNSGPETIRTREQF